MLLGGGHSRWFPTYVIWPKWWIAVLHVCRPFVRFLTNLGRNMV